jgi:arylsulfatase A-like enzyme
MLISIDTTRADYLTFDDPDTAPNLTGAAQRGTIFEQAVAGSNWTLPSHAQMLSGMAPAYHGSEMDRVTLDPAIPLVSEILKQAGYQTLGVYSNPLLWGNYGFDRGFDYYHSAMLPENAHKDEIRYAPRGQAAVERMEKLGDAGLVSAPTVLTIAKRALERTKPDQPIFLFAHIMEPHADYIPPPPWDTRFDPDYEGDFNPVNYIYNPEVVDYSKQPARQISDRDLQHVRALYRGEVAASDDAIGKLLEVLEQHDRLENTLVIVTADHGEAFFEHGKPGHRGLFRDTVMRIPLLVIPPAGEREGIARRSSASVTLSDLLPTILDYAAIEPPEVATGRSLRPAIEQGAFEGRPALFSDYRVKFRSDGEREHTQTYGLRSPTFKVIRRAVIVDDRIVRLTERYWDLAKDPDEKSPVKDANDPRLAKALARLDERLAEARRHWDAHPRTPRDERDVYVDGWFEELKMLGYFVAGDEQADVESLKPWGLAPGLPQRAN